MADFPTFFSVIFCTRRDYLYLCRRKRMKGGGAVKLLFFILIRFNLV